MRAASSLLADHLAEARRYRDAADNLPGMIGDEINTVLIETVDALCNVALGPAPAYTPPPESATATEQIALRVAYWRAKLEYDRRLVAHACERFDTTVDMLLTTIADSAEVGDGAASVALTAVVLDAYPRYDEDIATAEDGSDNENLDAWRARFAAAQAAAAIDPEGPDVNRVTLDAIRHIRYKLADGDREFASDLIDLVAAGLDPAGVTVQGGAEGVTVLRTSTDAPSETPERTPDRPAVSPNAPPAPTRRESPSVIEVDFRPAPRRPPPPSDLPPAAVAEAPSAPSVPAPAFTTHSVQAYADAGRFGTEASVTISAEGDRYRLELHGAGFGEVSAATSGDSADLMCADPDSIRALAGALLGALAAAERAGVIGVAGSSAPAAPAPAATAPA